jgi:hypothetical protein
LNWRNLFARIAEFSGGLVREGSLIEQDLLKPRLPKSIEFLGVSTWCGGPLSNAL